MGDVPGDLSASEDSSRAHDHGEASGNRVDQVGGEDEAREDDIDIVDELLDEVGDNSTANKLQLK